MIVPLIKDKNQKPDDVEIWCEIGGPQWRGVLYLTVPRESPKCHTHGPLDATFRQTYVKLYLAELEDDTDAVDILDHFLNTSGLDVGTREGAKAYKRIRQLNGSSGLTKLTWPCPP